MKPIISILLLLSMNFLPMKAQDATAGRSSAYCGLLNRKIYCYGGSYVRGSIQHADSAMYVLDITKADKTSMDTLSNNWLIENSMSGGVIEKRYDGQSATVDGTFLIVSGGFNDDTTPIFDQTRVYNVRTNTWKKYPDYEESPYGNRQIYIAATTVVSGKGLAFYGGYEQNINSTWAMETNQNLTATVFSGNIRRIGYTQVTYFDINNDINPWTITTPRNPAPSFFSSHQSSIYDPVSAKIFYFGGGFGDTLLPSYNSSIAFNRWHPFSSAMTFNTMTNQWGNQTLGGNDIPSIRRYHTTTVLPREESNIVLLYGGEESSFKPLADYCYILDLTSYTWTRQNIVSPDDMHRTKHSAVLVNNDSLFIVNGINSQFTTTSTPIVLNISNPRAITYMQTYTDPNINSVENRTSLSSGAIAGIAVGASIAGILIIAILVTCLRRKKIKQKKQEQEAPEPKNEPDNDDHEPMEVDWDEIEKQYVESIPGVKLTQAYQPVLDVAACSEPTFGEETTTIIVSDTFSSPRSNNYATNTVTHLPNTFEQPRLVQKPDVSS